ncbi:phosphopantothenoylcysteine decarboxylase domain-containing protein, partial [Streptomyces sp. NPDC003328]
MRDSRRTFCPPRVHRAQQGARRPGRSCALTAVEVGTAVQLREAVLKAAADADAVVMAAAVAD